MVKEETVTFWKSSSVSCCHRSGHQRRYHLLLCYYRFEENFPWAGTKTIWNVSLAWEEKWAVVVFLYEVVAALHQ